MRIYFRPCSPVLSALVIGAGYCIAFICVDLSAALANDNITYSSTTVRDIKLAAGFPIGPSPRTPTPGPVVPPSGPTTPSTAPENANPTPQGTGLGNNGAEIKPVSVPVKPAEPFATEKKMGTIEYDISLAPISSQPGLSVVQSMND